VQNIQVLVDFTNIKAISYKIKSDSWHIVVSATNCQKVSPLLQYLKNSYM